MNSQPTHCPGCGTPIVPGESNCCCGDNGADDCGNPAFTGCMVVSAAVIGFVVLVAAGVCWVIWG